MKKKEYSTKDGSDLTSYKNTRTITTTIRMMLKNPKSKREMKSKSKNNIE